jgi:hypothetical protein
MRIALLSDVHANLHALDSVLADVAARPTSPPAIKGDLVGYSAFPTAVARLDAEGSRDRRQRLHRRDRLAPVALLGERRTGRSRTRASPGRSHTTDATKHRLAAPPSARSARSAAMSRTDVTLVHATPDSNLV